MSLLDITESYTAYTFLTSGVNAGPGGSDATSLYLDGAADVAFLTLRFSSALPSAGGTDQLNLAQLLICPDNTGCALGGNPTLTLNKAGYVTTNVSATPIPAAFPLFASGLEALGLFGWRRKRKNVAALAAA